jgi:NAD-dependent DNA ligase
VKAWGSRLAKQGVLDPDAVDWVVEPKVDGLAVRIVFRCGWVCGGEGGLPPLGGTLWVW